MRLTDRLFGSRTTPHRSALAQAQTGVTVYWRPGCPFCLALRTRIGRYADRAAWVDIWADPAGRAYVASVNGGDETVPTVVIDGVPHTNPSPGAVRATLCSRTP